ncbi:hypothetical protein VSX64_21110 [Aurantimonas sp. C2-6-R+9]|uniref:hypothetical protein n=1 Tax=unclassified Aurantimonas TaxID=2638230 RepID=UPI002E19A183|nr:MULTISPECIES: hypothetical protein [unclassified Aurantimonas]MEC5293390.1 hypothetical protein [Aurantimonas sp. C2-3-R2]MEC5325868.1 hypothetical protein [Aurantimonas sp. A3-2-R12]MEC5383306.1 hypothetical protein [Aurantimonas sp. C2-6-R+9]MEC5414472.1 hypothetical protein [Aurantimonas sp. C2-4-R8]
MSNYRDPKVTITESKSNVGKLIGIALAVILGLLLLAWALGTFDDEAETVPVVTEEPATLDSEPAASPPTNTEPAAVPPAN